MISVIIPAHNEEQVIGATLTALSQGIKKNTIEVIVVCNGCIDNTIRVVKSFGEAVQCIETSVPSKANALNMGDKKAQWFPRIYLDADVVLPLESVEQIAQVLADGYFLAASPEMRMDLHHATWPVRCYYEVWQQLPYVRAGMIGTGIYALSKQGRQRFSEFPQIIADDGYIRAIFKEHERVSLDTCHSLVRAPTNIEGLLKIKTRSRLGRYELGQRFPEIIQNEEKRYGNALFCLIYKINLWAKIPIYLYVNLVSRYRAKRYIQEKGFTGWERDNSSRDVVK